MKAAPFFMLALTASLLLPFSVQGAPTQPNKSSSNNQHNYFNPNLDPLLMVRNAWIPPTEEHQDVAPAYMTIETPVSTRIISIYCPWAEKVVFYQTDPDNNDSLTNKQPLPYPIPLTSSFPLKLFPTKKFIMLIGLKRRLKTGDQVPFTFQLHSAMYNDTTDSAITAMIPVRVPPKAYIDRELERMKREEHPTPPWLKRRPQ